MTAPKTGARIRMYRQGQGDCFLIAFPRVDGDENDPVYVLIDCGYIGGSQFESVTIRDVIDHIVESTGGVIDYVIVSHEHTDHVNGFTVKDSDGAPLFDRISIKNLWLAWTEDDEPFANDLRKRYQDQLVALAMAERQMTELGFSGDGLDNVSALLELELGPENERGAFTRNLHEAVGPMFTTFCADSIDGINNKLAIKYLRNKSERPPSFLRPGQKAFEIEGTLGIRTYVLGPPRDETLLQHLDPVGREQFHISPGFALSGEVEAFHAAVTNLQNGGAASPFARRYARSEEEIFGMELDAQTPREAESQIFQYNSRIYCEAGKPATKEKWRRIDGEWLKSSNSLALRLNNEVNNTSLVLAFELPTTKKVLLFTGDAQRGNWISWSDQSWETPEKKIVTAKDILSRCVFYKCGHHGSHNATLNGTADDDYPNLGWFARGEYSKDFVAMVPVHSSWARSKRGWQHPLPEIENALMKKARGRVVFNDRECVTRPNPNAKIGRLTDDEWLEFEQGKVETNVYKEITVWD